jgi:hypothetical protein
MWECELLALWFLLLDLLHVTMCALNSIVLQALRPSSLIFHLQHGTITTTVPASKAQVMPFISPPFPPAVFYQLQLSARAGQVFSLPAPLDIIPLHYRGGSIVPTQAPAVTTTAARTNPFAADVALDDMGAAEGWAYIDDGVSISAPYTMLHMVASAAGSCAGTVRISATTANYKPSVVFGKFRVMGLNPSCYTGSAPVVTANSRAVAPVQWVGGLLTFDTASLAINVAEALVLAFAPPAAW